MLQDGQLQQSGSGVDDPTATTADVARKGWKWNPRMPIGDEYGKQIRKLEGLNGYKPKNVRILSPNMERLG